MSDPDDPFVLEETEEGVVLDGDALADEEDLEEPELDDRPSETLVKMGNYRYGLDALPPEQADEVLSLRQIARDARGALEAVASGTKDEGTLGMLRSVMGRLAELVTESSNPDVTIRASRALLDGLMKMEMMGRSPETEKPRKQPVVAIQVVGGKVTLRGKEGE